MATDGLEGSNKQPEPPPNEPAVLLDGQQETDGLQDEVSRKLEAFRAQKAKPWQRGSSEAGAEAGVPIEGDHRAPSALQRILHRVSSHNEDEHAQAAFKPVKLAVAKVRNNDANWTDQQDGQEVPARIPKRTTMALPESHDMDPTASDIADEEANSYLELGQRPPSVATTSRTASSSSSSLATLPEQEKAVLQWLRKTPAKSIAHTFSSKHKNEEHHHDTSDLAHSPSRRTWRGRVRKTSRTSSRHESDDGIEMASQPVRDDASQGTAPKRRDTLRGMFTNRSDSFKLDVPLNKRQLPFFKRKKKRKGKKRTDDSDSDSDAGDLDDEELFHETLLRAGLLDKDVPEQWFTEALWENQRGIFLLGARYGRNARLPGDPYPWTDLHGNDTAYDINNYPLPTPAWQWYHSEWLVSMMGDVDDQGFRYSTRFSSKYWRGIPGIRFFVRKRLWIRTRYRPTLKAQAITQLTRSSHLQADLGGPVAQSGRQRSSSTVPHPKKRGSSNDRLFLPILANHLDLVNPFLSWKTLKAESRAQVGDPLADNDDEDDSAPVPFKQDVIHANFIRTAKVLVRRTMVDRERLAWWEYWLGEREMPLHVTDVHAGAGMPDHEKWINAGAGNILQDVQEDKHAEDLQRPDSDDVWDLLEDRLDDLLMLFEYQDTRRRFLAMLGRLHNSSHAQHHYKGYSGSPDGPAELEPSHEHGRSEELGASGSVRAENGDGTHADEEPKQRLKFWSDVERRIQEMNKAKFADGVSR